MNEVNDSKCEQNSHRRQGKTEKIQKKLFALKNFTTTLQLQHKDCKVTQNFHDEKILELHFTNKITMYLLHEYINAIIRVAIQGE